MHGIFHVGTIFGSLESDSDLLPCSDFVDGAATLGFSSFVTSVISVVHDEVLECAFASYVAARPNWDEGIRFTVRSDYDLMR